MADTAEPQTDSARLTAFHSQVKRLELLVYARNQQAALAEFQRLLILLKELSVGPNSQDRNLAWLQLSGSSVWTRLASALISLLTDPGTRIDQDLVARVALSKEELQNVFALSGFLRTACFIPLLAGEAESDWARIPRPRLLLLLALLALDDIPTALLRHALTLPPGELQVLYIGWLTQRSVLTAQGETNRSLLLQAHARLAETALAPEHFKSAVSVWMYCSYAEDAAKHRLKQTINSLILQLPKREAITPRAKDWSPGERPTLLVVAEKFKSGHAMERCFHDRIAQLRSRFRVLLLIADDQYEESQLGVFDKVLPLPAGGIHFEGIVAKVRQESPDIIYYPSLGMLAWTVLLANLRMAPVQIMGSGHPASSMTNTIDYFITSGTARIDAEAFSEIVVQMDHDAAFVPHKDHESFPLPSRAGKPHVDIAINSKTMKLSYRLLEVCRQLKSKTRRELRFHFMPGERGLLYAGLATRINRLLPGALVYPETSYQQHMKSLANCDLALAGFPFGNSNGTVDASLLAVPTVALLGREPHAQTDWRVLSRLGVASHLVATTVEEYFGIALHLVEDEAFRTRLQTQLGETAVKHRIYTGMSVQQGLDFAGTVDWMFRQHPRLQSLGRRHYLAGETLD